MEGRFRDLGGPVVGMDGGCGSQIGTCVVAQCVCGCDQGGVAAARGVSDDLLEDLLEELDDEALEEELGASWEWGHGSLGFVLPEDGDFGVLGRFFRPWGV